MSTERRSISCCLCMTVLCVAVIGVGVATAQPASPPTFSLSDFKAALIARIASTRARDTSPVRVAKGQSCVEAAQDRAAEIAMVVKAFQFSGEFADYGAKVGKVSGWRNLVTGNSWHTYSVVEIYDSTGKTLYTIDADNYVGPIIVSDHATVNWDAPNVRLVEEVDPPYRINAAIEGPGKVHELEMVSLIAKVTDPPPYVTFPLSYEWRRDGDNTVIGNQASIAGFPKAGTHAYNVTIYYMDTRILTGGKTNQKTILARLKHTVIVSPPTETRRTGSQTPTDVPSASTPARSLAGSWQGTWTNSRTRVDGKKQSGVGTITLSVDANGVVTGNDDGQTIENGRRTGDTMTWTSKTSDGWRRWETKVQILDGGNTLVVSYTGHDKETMFKDGGTYTGSATLRRK